MKLFWSLYLLSNVWVSAQQDTNLVRRGSKRQLQSQCPDVLEKLEIINASTDQKVASLLDGDTIYLDSAGLASPQDINIKAVTCGTSVGSVKFSLDGNYYQRIENAGPYLMCANSGSDAFSCPEMTLGKHTLTVSVHSLINAGGSLLGSIKTISFTVAQSNTMPITTTSRPVQSPAPSPLPAPKPKPTLAPVPASNVPTTRAPTVPATTVPAPTVPTPTVPTPSCTIPKLIGEWVDTPKYPFFVLESHGAMIGKDFVILSGFKNQFDQTTLETYALDTSNSTATWRRMDDAPLSVAPGFSHAAFTVVGTKVYLCGGYLGPNPGRDFSNCVVYDHSVAPGSGKQWSSIASLPDGRGGAGMIYDKKRHALYFASGADRAQGTTHSYDKADTWMYDLNKPGLGWVQKANIPYQANHMSAVTATDGLGKVRHFFLGGQKGEQEANGNFAKNYEWDAENERWIERADMALPRGHFSSSTRPIGCGFLIAGGTANGMGKISDISYYDIDNDKWTKIGDLWAKINTPICDIASYSNGEKWLYCDGHWSGRKRIRISV